MGSVVERPDDILDQLIVIVVQKRFQVLALLIRHRVVRQIVTCDGCLTNPAFTNGHLFDERILSERFSRRRSVIRTIRRQSVLDVRCDDLEGDARLVLLLRDEPQGVMPGPVGVRASYVLFNAFAFPEINEKARL